MSRAGGEMALVIGFDALRRLSDPAAAVEDAGRWTVEVGVAAEDYDELRAFLDREGVEPGFVAGERGLIGGLAAVRQRVTADRHVFVGTTDEDRATAEAVGWEYLAVEMAAGKAGWGLTAEDEGS
ncbi:hypothetical protein BRC90_05965 [Halobacteriales archaeon QS_4_69_34]|nr:MAG: hypothetical protein BRC90_05965 [Halobacteriales archaeon QS_4_69_34]